MPHHRISVSRTNTKMHCPSLSLPPGLTCLPGVPCLGEGCYADRMYHRGIHPGIKKSYDANWALYRADSVAFFDQLSGWFHYDSPRYFRWFVSGDIPDLSFFNLMLHTCRITPGTKHLCFTKRADVLEKWATLGFDHSDLPANLSLLYSVWPGVRVPEAAVLCDAYAYISTDPRTADLPASSACPGDCADCGRRCWHTPTDVVFPKH